MKSYKIESRVSRASTADETQSLAPRPKLNPMHEGRIGHPPETALHFFAICARIGVAMLYGACAIAAIA
jgi:hypothetical protein